MMIYRLHVHNVQYNRPITISLHSASLKARCHIAAPLCIYMHVRK